MKSKNTKEVTDRDRDDDGMLFGLDDFTHAESEEAEEATTTMDEEHREVHLHYPQPTALSIVVQAVAKWSELNFVMDPSLNRPLQIFAPRKMPKAEALQIFVASLETIGLRAVQMQGKVVKIVPMNFGRVSA